MKKKLYNLITLISIFCLIICICCKASYNKFNSSNIKNNIEYLSSCNFNGRLAGTHENDVVAEEIENSFKKFKLSPLSDDYKEKFTTVIPKYTGGKSSLKLIDKNKNITEFSLGKDFKEDFLNFKTSSIEFSKDNKIDIFTNGFSVFKDNVEYLFYVNIDKSFSFRSSFYENSKYGFVIQISTQTFSKILDSIRNGSILKVDLPYTTCEKEIWNVAGKINGFSKKLPPLILTAHFDHVGADSLGQYYPGALDNASGISFLLETAKNYSSLLMPKRDIIFVALNAEELGLKGSENFASKYKDTFPDAEIINFDMIGIDNYPLTLMSGKNCNDDNSKILKDMENICNKENINFDKTFADSSDHASFINNGFDALTLSHSDLTNIHTPNDTYDKISVNAINSVFKIVDSEINNLAYNHIFLIFYNKNIVIVFTISTVFLIFYKILNIKKAA